MHTKTTLNPFQLRSFTQSSFSTLLTHSNKNVPLPLTTFALLCVARIPSTLDSKFQGKSMPHDQRIIQCQIEFRAGRLANHTDTPDQQFWEHLLQLTDSQITCTHTHTLKINDNFVYFIVNEKVEFSAVFFIACILSVSGFEASNPIRVAREFRLRSSDSVK